MSYDLLEPNAKVRLSTYAPAILGARYENLVVESKCSYNKAREIADVANIHNQVLSSLPSGTPEDPRLLTYYEFFDGGANRNTILAKEWINAASIEVIANASCKIEIYSMGSADFARIDLALKSIGVTDFAVKPLT